jgi:hypothetical protein
MARPHASQKDVEKSKNRAALKVAAQPGRSPDQLDANPEEEKLCLAAVIPAWAPQNQEQHPQLVQGLPPSNGCK